MRVFYHWPDHVIGKRESRTIREEHNALGNLAHELLDSLHDTYRALREYTDGAESEAMAAILNRAEEVRAKADKLLNGA